MQSKLSSEQRLTFIEKAFFSVAWVFPMGGFTGELQEDGSQLKRNALSTVLELFLIKMESFKDQITPNYYKLQRNVMH